MLSVGDPGNLVTEWGRKVKEENKEHRDYRRRLEYEVKKSGIGIRVKEYSDNLDAEMGAVMRCVLSVKESE